MDTSPANIAPFLPERARGPLSDRLLTALGSDPGNSVGAQLDDLGDAAALAALSPDPLHDGDIQLSLFLLYALHYGSIPASAEWEWNTDLIQARRVLEASFEEALRRDVPGVPQPDADRESVAGALFALTSADDGPSLSHYVARKATDEQLHEFLMQRSIYTLREADPHSWAIPRLTGAPKVAMVEIQSDEYGGGRPEWMHATIFARTMEGLGLDSGYGAYVDHVPAVTLASLNMMSMFGINRRLRGAIVGHLAAFEMTSSLPNRQYGNGFRRLGYGPDVTLYFDEHVEADAVHEQIASRDLAGVLAEQEPGLLPDILFGASACLYVDGLAGRHMLEAWTSGRSSLENAPVRTAAV